MSQDGGGPGSPGELGREQPGTESLMRSDPLGTGQPVIAHVGRDDSGGTLRACVERTVILPESLGNIYQP